MKTKQGKLFVISGPSGVGKTTICKELCASFSNLKWSVSCTTRQKRNQEVEGQDYYFLSKEKFLERIQQDGFIEYALVHGNYYGTPKKEIEESLQKGNNCLLEIDVQGGRKVKSDSAYTSVLIFIAPPAMNTLLERLHGRHSDTEETIQKRIQNAQKEMKDADFYDYIVVNENLQECIEKVKKIVSDQMM
ncbi:MAG: guanylate kinase [Candidatus Brocadiae bacterium]|nr:guanylate kinase [Candidatus Brocadiia bacterium]